MTKVNEQNTKNGIKKTKIYSIRSQLAVVAVLSKTITC